MSPGVTNSGSKLLKVLEVSNHRHVSLRGGGRTQGFEGICAVHLRYIRIIPPRYLLYTRCTLEYYSLSLCMDTMPHWSKSEKKLILAGTDCMYSYTSPEIFQRLSKMMFLQKKLWCPGKPRGCGVITGACVMGHTCSGEGGTPLLMLMSSFLLNIKT
eukprot:767836-Amorphochlora_amoeboformis.AAC.1